MSARAKIAEALRVQARAAAKVAKLYAEAADELDRDEQPETFTGPITPIDPAPKVVLTEMDRARSRRALNKIGIRTR